MAKRRKVVANEPYSYCFFQLHDKYAFSAYHGREAICTVGLFSCNEIRWVNKLGVEFKTTASGINVDHPLQVTLSFPPSHVFYPTLTAQLFKDQKTQWRLLTHAGQMVGLEKKDCFIFSDASDLCTDIVKDTNQLRYHRQRHKARINQSASDQKISISWTMQNAFAQMVLQTISTGRVSNTSIELIPNVTLQQWPTVHQTDNRFCGLHALFNGLLLLTHAPNGEEAFQKVARYPNKRAEFLKSAAGYFMSRYYQHHSVDSQLTLEYLDQSDLKELYKLPSTKHWKAWTKDLLKPELCNWSNELLFVNETALDVNKRIDELHEIKEVSQGWSSSKREWCFIVNALIEASDSKNHDEDIRHWFNLYCKRVDNGWCCILVDTILRGRTAGNHYKSTVVNICTMLDNWITYHTPVASSTGLSLSIGLPVVVQRK